MTTAGSAKPKDESAVLDQAVQPLLQTTVTADDDVQRVQRHGGHPLREKPA
jgi:hypothetical protein